MITNKDFTRRFWGFTAKGRCLFLGLLVWQLSLSYGQSFQYGGNPYCNTSNMTATPTTPMGSSGTYTLISRPNPTDTLTDFNLMNGSFLPNMSNPGTYVVRLITNGMMADTLFASVIIDALPATLPTISYTTPLCKLAPGALPTLTGITNGTFSTNPMNSAISVDPITGLLDLTGGMEGSTYNIVYTYSSPYGVCSGTVSTSVTIAPTPSAAFTLMDSVFCQGDPTNPTASFTGTGGMNTFSSTPTNIINATSGEITLSGNSGPFVITNDFAKDGCTVTSSKAITIETLPNTLPTVTYDAATYCKTGPDPVPVVLNTGNLIGRFSTTGSVNIDSITGKIDLSTAPAPGTYTFTYTYKSPLGACSGSIDKQIMIVGAPDPVFTYPQAVFCKSSTSVQASGTAAGANLFSSSPVGLISDNSTGSLNFGANAGTYIVTNTKIANGCTTLLSLPVTLEPVPTASIMYGRASYCGSAPDTVPQIIGTKGGKFISSPPLRLRIDSTTGSISFNQSVEGNYEVKYIYKSPLGSCVDTARTNIAVIRPPNPAFRYSASFFCKNEPDPSPVDTILLNPITNGNFSAVGNPSTLNMNINSLTGLIDLANTDVGTYIVTNELTGNGCSESFSFSVTVSDTISSSISYTGSPFCQSGTDPIADISGPRGGAFSSISGTVVFADSVNGVIDLDASPSGNFTISYVSPIGCGNTATFPIQIQAATDSPRVSLANGTICEGDNLPAINITGQLSNPLWYNSSNPVTQLSFTGIPANAAALGFDSSMVGLQTVYVTDSAAFQCRSAFVPINLSVDSRAGITVSLSPQVTNVCSNEEITIIAGSGPTSYRFLVNGADSSGITSSNTFKLSNFPTNPTNLQVVGNPGSCPVNSTSISLTVTQAPTASPIQIPPFTFGPTPTPISLNNLFTLTPGNAVITFSAPRGVTSAGANYDFNPTDPSIMQGVLDSVTVSYEVKLPGSPACAITDSFKIKVDPNNKLSNALKYPNRAPLASSFCNDIPTFSFYVIMGGFAPYTNICSLYVDSAGMSLGRLTHTLVRGDTFMVDFDPRTLNPGSYSFQLDARESGTGSSCISQGGFPFTIKPIPDNPMVSAPVLPSCEGAVNDLITIDNHRPGTNYLWFSDPTKKKDTTTTASTFNTGAQKATMGNQVIYYVKAEQQLCESRGFDTTALTIYPIPGPLTVTPAVVDFCEGDRVPTVTIQTTLSGQRFDWYDSQDNLLITRQSLTFDPTSYNNITGSGSMILKVVEKRYAAGSFGGCSSIDSSTSITLNQIQRPLPPTLLDSSRQNICAGVSPDSFAVREVGDIIWWSDFALTDSVYGGNPIPGNALPIDTNKVGTDRVYVTIGNQGCNSNPVFYEFNINPKPRVSFTNLDSIICNGQGDIQLFGVGSSPYSPNDPGISFTLRHGVNDTIIPSGFSQDLLKTDGLPSGRYKVTYMYTDGVGCVGDTTQFISINPSPKAGFSINGNCVGERFELIDTSTLEMTGIDSIVTKAWDYFTTRDSGDTSFIESFPNAGLIKVTLQVITNNGCEDTEVTEVFIGSKPKADFTWTQKCEGDTTIFEGFTEANVLRDNEKISGFTWDFGEGLGPEPSGQLDDSTNIITVKNEFTPGIYHVTLTLTSASRDPNIKTTCSDEVNHRVYIHPTVQVNPDRDYFENFEDPNHGWLAQPIFVREDDTPDWRWAIPIGSTIRPDSLGMHAWITMTDTSNTPIPGYSPGEQSWVVSPCFDLRTVNQPMVSMDIWSQTVEGRDGTVLQVTRDDGETWKIVGSYEDGENTGLNWYNQSTISAKPGEQDFGLGWTGRDTAWHNARHKLDDFIGHPNIRFRVAFGSDENHIKGSKLEGFAFDNFFVGERKQRLLMEHFTNLRDPATVSDRATMYKLNKFLNNELDIIPIQYHIAFEPDDLKGDRINLRNEDDPEARAFQYAIPYVGRVALNGNEYKDASFFYAPTFDSSRVSQRLINKRVLEDPLFSIDSIKFEKGTNSISVEARITANKSPYVGEEVFVFFALLEDRVPDRRVYLQSVFRKFMPDNGGSVFFENRSWDKDSSEVIQESIAISDVPFDDINELYAVVFVQEKDSNRVYQAASTKPLPQGMATVNIEEPLSEKTFLTYPNPVKDYLYIEFEQGTTGPLNWALIDLGGKIWANGMVQPHAEDIYALNLIDLPAGIYLLQLKDSAGNIFRKKVVKMN